ncbi:MAG: tRNA (adenosine(37)-N6)-dimethylallyltransferase MiaA [Candidatus Pacebacteria bacterium]|nr:tRNA (adenosine(37)-N6)-dimethylallyltransferase MiaA [Candidatus Paceibacterota bacterium]
MTSPTKPKLLVIVGPTASGKSDLAVRLALAHNGEVISADSRQVYTGLDIGTGKITTAEMQGVPHHLLDVASPHDRMTAIDWKVLAEKSIADIIARGKLPIICGGTGFYISALIDDLGFPDVEADTDEQKELEAKTVDELFLELKKVDPARSSTIDPKNKRRLARAIIIARRLGAVPPVTKPVEPKYDTLMIGITWPDDELKSRIQKRLVSRIDAGMIEEAQKLNSPDGGNLSFERMEELGLEYRFLAYFLKKELTKEELIERLSSKIWQYAKRQMTWFKKDARIQWFAPTEFEGVEKKVVEFLKS